MRIRVMLVVVLLALAVLTGLIVMAYWVLPGLL